MNGWRRRAACWKTSVDFHSDKNPQPAQEVCRRCPVQDQCLAWSVKVERRDNTSMNGIWGGMTTAERRAKYPLDKSRYRQAERKLA